MKRTITIDTDKDQWVIVKNEALGKGNVLIEAIMTPSEILIVGLYPSDNDSDDEPKPGDHNCDAMGCTSVSHVNYRFPIPHALYERNVVKEWQI